MADAEGATTFAELSCCPQLEECNTCDVLDIRYRLPFRPLPQRGDQRRIVPVEVTLHFRLTRCPGPLSLGDLVYTTTLLPGEQVRLFTSDRHSRFSFDTESKLAYRQHTTSEESYYMAGMANSMSDLSILDTTNKTSTFGESSVSGGGSAGIDIGIAEIGGSVAASSYNSEATLDLTRELTQHAESSHRHVEVGTRAAASTSVGEVASRTHTEGESEDQFESSSRVFANPNRCHALTFFFYRINKCQTVRFELVRIERRVDDPSAPAGAVLNPPPPANGLAVVPDGLLATRKDRLSVERAARTSMLERLETQQVVRSPLAGRFGGSLATAVIVQEAVAAELKAAALKQVDAELAEVGLLDAKSGEVTEEAKKRFSWEQTSSLPTPGVIVKGCLDDCDVCEPSLDEEIKLDLERRHLENELLKRKIELLEQSQEYRCCPEGSEEDGPEV